MKLFYMIMRLKRVLSFILGLSLIVSTSVGYAWPGHYNKNSCANLEMPENHPVNETVIEKCTDKLGIQFYSLISEKRWTLGYAFTHYLTMVDEQFLLELKDSQTGEVNHFLFRYDLYFLDSVKSVDNKEDYDYSFLIKTNTSVARDVLSSKNKSEKLEYHMDQDNITLHPNGFIPTFRYYTQLGISWFISALAGD